MPGTYWHPYGCKLTEFNVTIQFRLNPPSKALTKTPISKGNYPCIAEASLRNSMKNTATHFKWLLKDKQIPSSV